MSDHHAEQHLSQLRPRAVPTELRQQVLGRLATVESTRMDGAPCQGKPASNFDVWVNVAIAVSLLIAAGLWYVNLRIHPARIATLIGPPPAQRQAERAMQTLALDDDPARAPMLVFLRWHFRHSGRPDRPAPLPHSAAYIERRSLTLRKPENVETNLEVHGPGGGDTSDRRRRPAMVVAGTA
jgi:hypothetical protein